MRSTGEPQVAIRLLLGITPEQARDARVRAWAYVFQSWYTKKGVQHELTKNSTRECTRPDKKGNNDADLHGN